MAPGTGNGISDSFVKVPSRLLKGWFLMRAILSVVLLCVVLGGEGCYYTRNDTEFHRIMRRREFAKAETMVERNPRVIENLGQHGQTAMFQAIRKYDLEAFEWLLVKGANVNAQDRWKQTPLHIAVMQGRTDIVERLIRAGADVNAKNYKGRTLLYFARMYNREEIVSILREAGAME
ncbi:MAG: ankyrin repeat domain-containing protein [Planctomycetota bacterium]|jgi:ankyrin repeat protein